MPKKKEVKKEGLTMMILGKEVELKEKCWKGYEKKGMKTMFGKRYPNCVKKEEVEITVMKVTTYLQLMQQRLVEQKMK